jgi:hypothetical protein
VTVDRVVRPSGPDAEPRCGEPAPAAHTQRHGERRQDPAHAAVTLALLGVVLLIAGRLDLGRLPGDILIERDGVTILIPLGSMLC